MLTLFLSILTVCTLPMYEVFTNDTYFLWLMKFTPTILIHNITVSNLVNVLRVDLGNTELNYAALKEKNDEFASHVLVFLVRRIVLLTL